MAHFGINTRKWTRSGATLATRSMAGYHLNRHLFLGADLGLRVRMDTRKPTSLWTSIHGDASASYLHFGLKFGWAF